MNTKAESAAAALLIGVLCFFTACSPKEQTDTIDSGKSGDRVTLKAAHWDISMSPYITGLIAAFEEAHPNIAIEIIDIPSTDYTRKLQILLNGSGDVDAFWIKDGDTTNVLNDRGQLADLSAYIYRDTIDMAAYHGLAERFIMDNKTTALPASTGYYILYYNKTIFDNAGLPYPSNNMTWDEWENLAKQVTSGTGNNKIYGAYLHTWNACVQNWGIQDAKHTIMDTDYSFFKPAYEMVLRMQDEGTLWDYGSLRSGEIHYSNAFFCGNVAMMPMGTWFYTVIIDRIKRNETNIAWGIATLPHPAGLEAGWTVGSVTPIAINQASAYKDEAWEFIKFITSDEGAKIYASYGQIPSRADSSSFAAIAVMDGMPSGSLEALAVKNIALDRPLADQVEEVNQMLDQEHRSIMLGAVSIEQGLANMSKRSREIQGMKY